MASGSLLLYLLLIGAGVTFGAYGTLIGVGGGFLIVPFLLLELHVESHQAAGTSLLAVFLSAVSGSVSYARQGRIDVRSGLVFALFTLPGAVLGGYAAASVSGTIFRRVFGGLLLGLASVLLLGTRARPATGAVPAEAPAMPGEPPADNARSPGFSWPLGIGLSIVIGFVSSFFGIGGGVIQVPAFIHLLHFPPHVATATSLFVMIFTAGAGSVAYTLQQNVLWDMAIPLGIGVIIGGQAGARYSRHVRGPWLMRLLTLALAIVGVRLLLK